MTLEVEHFADKVSRVSVIRFEAHGCTSQAGGRTDLMDVSLLLSTNGDLGRQLTCMFFSRKALFAIIRPSNGLELDTGLARYCSKIVPWAQKAISPIDHNTKKDI